MKINLPVVHLILVPNDWPEDGPWDKMSWSVFFSPGKGKKAKYTGWSFSHMDANKLERAKKRYENQYLRHHKLTRDQVEFKWEERQLKPTRKKI